MVENSFNNNEKSMTTKDSSSNKRRSFRTENKEVGSSETKKRSSFSHSPAKNDLIKNSSQGPKKKVKYRKRMFPIILRVIFILLLLIGSLVLGLMFGYGILGEEEAKEVLDKSVWQHILGIIKTE